MMTITFIAKFGEHSGAINSKTVDFQRLFLGQSSSECYNI